MAKHRAIRPKRTRTVALVTGAVASGTLFAGAVDQTAQADASCPSSSDIGRGSECGSTAMNLALGLHPNALADNVITLAFGSGWRNPAPGSPSGHGGHPFQSISDAVASAWRAFTSPPNPTPGTTSTMAADEAAARKPADTAAARLGAAKKATVPQAHADAPSTTPARATEHFAGEAEGDPERRPTPVEEAPAPVRDARAADDAASTATTDRYRSRNAAADAVTLVPDTARLDGELPTVRRGKRVEHVPSAPTGAVAKAGDAFDDADVDHGDDTGVHGYPSGTAAGLPRAQSAEAGDTVGADDIPKLTAGTAATPDDRSVSEAPPPTDSAS